MQLLLLSKDTADIEFFRDTTGYAGIGFGIASSASQLTTQLAKDPDTIIAIDVSTEALYREFEDEISSRFGLYSQAINSNRFFYISAKEFDEVPYLLQSEIFGTFIQRNYKEGSSKHLARLIKLISNKEEFNFEKFFTDKIKIQTIQIKQANQKKTIVEALRAQLQTIGFKTRAATMIATASDEIIMNGIFDAPVDATGKYIYAQTPRSTQLDLDEQSKVEFKIGFDGEYVAVSVLDPFGSLDKKKLLSHIQKSYKKEEFKVKTNIAGAGLGLANAYRNCAGILFECDMGTKTQVTIFYKKTDSFKDFKDQFRFLSTMMYFSNG